MVLPSNHIMSYEGSQLNWFVGDAVSPTQEPSNRRQPSIFWVWGMIDGWNTRNAIYCGKFNSNTREVYDVKKLTR